MDELVVLVDEQNTEIGTAPKDSVHTTNTPLHRGFSLFLFNSKNEVLLTKRSKTKKTFSGVWTNTVCGHPAPGESVVNAAKRRLKDELGIDLDVESPKRTVLSAKGPSLIRVVAPYRYRFSDANGIVENEICPILVAHADVDPKPKQEEVEDWKWMGWERFLRDIEDRTSVYSPWCVDEVNILKHIDFNMKYA